MEKPNPLKDAILSGNPDRVRVALRDGGDIEYRDEVGFDPLMDAAYRVGSRRPSRLLELLQVLIDHGAKLDGVSKYRETALRGLSRKGWFDAVQLLLQAGADDSMLNWTPLMKAVAFGSIDEVRDSLKRSPDLEQRDWLDRTAFLLAATRGDTEITQLLLDAGADIEARSWCGHPSLFHAITGHSPRMVRWLLETGAEVDQRDSYGNTALIEAVESDDLDCVNILLDAGADVHVDNNGTPATRALSREVCDRLIDAGADIAHINHRVMLGLPDRDEELLNFVSDSDYRRAWTRRFGRDNPERMQEPFWELMIRAGVPGFVARDRLGMDISIWDGPAWSAQRFGQTLTLLPDGRFIQIAGEHEDSYDPGLLHL